MNEELEQAQKIYDQITAYLVTNSFRIVVAIFILLVGIFVARKTSDLFLGLLLKRKIDVTLSNFAASALKIIIICMIAVVALEKIGISITPFVAAIGALSLGVGLALQGLLSNYGAGVSIILTRPFVVGDTVKLLGVAGIVKEVKLGFTVLTNEDHVLITIPNKHIVGEIIHNSKADSIVELKVGIAYQSDPDQAIDVIMQALTGLEGTSTERPPLVGIENFGDSSIEIGIRLWVKTEHFYQILYKANGLIFKALEANNIEIPFPQRDVHLIQSSH
jgi:small conductance mechanosensitive channel